MSCQQAPRLTEDPYVFTETVSTTPVLFNPQKSRQQQQFKQITQLPQQSHPIQAAATKQQDTSNVNVSQTYFSGRFNGTTTAIETPSASITQQQQIINGMQKNVISITTINSGNNSPAVPIKLPQQQCQHSHSKIVTTTPAVVSACCTLPTQVISWNQTQSSASPPAQHFQQQTQTVSVQQTSQQQQQQQQQDHEQELQSFFTLTPNCNSNAQNLQCTSPLLPPSNFHQITLAQHIQKVGSSSKNSTSRPPSAQQQQYSKITSHPQNQAAATATATHSREGVTTPTLSSSPSSHSSDSSHPAAVKQNHSDFNEIPVSVIYRNTPVKSEPGERSPRTSGESPVDLNATASPYDHKPLTVRKSIDFFEKSVVFATPAKRDSRVLSSSAKKSLKCTTTGGAPGKAKRTHSQTTHHEALQRISSSASSIGHHSSSSSLSLTGSSLSPPIRRKLKVRRNSGEWHAPDTYIFDSVSPLTSLIERRQRSAEKCDSTIASARASCVQQHWLGVYDLDDPVKVSPRTLNAGREERIERHKALLRRQAVQLISSQEFLRPTVARSRLVFVSKFLQKLKTHEDRSAQTEKCCVPSCTNYALALTTQCYIHITRDLDQHLFLPCTAKFADNTQCRIPVFDISHELPLCREHGWKRDNYNRIVQEQKPKAKLTRKRTKSTTLCGRPPKRSKKKRKGSTSSLESIGSSNTTLASTPTGPVTGALGPPSLSSNCMVPSIVVDDGGFPDSMMEGDYTASDFAHVVSQTNVSGMNMESNDDMDMLSSMRHHIPQDVQHMLNMCENSSVYPSSEDTGVGGLSESELMVGTQDAEEIPLSDTRLLEEHDLTNVLNNLPVAFNELFTVVHQDEREEVERALELADKQIKSLQQMTGNDSDFLRDLLDGSDQILDDTDICTEIVSPHSPDTSGIDTNTLFVDGGSNSTAGSCTGHTPTDIRGLVQT